MTICRYERRRNLLFDFVILVIAFTILPISVSAMDGDFDPSKPIAEWYIKADLKKEIFEVGGGSPGDYFKTYATVQGKFYEYSPYDLITYPNRSFGMGNLTGTMKYQMHPVVYSWYYPKCNDIDKTAALEDVEFYIDPQIDSENYVFAFIDQKPYDFMSSCSWGGDYYPSAVENTTALLWNLNAEVPIQEGPLKEGTYTVDRSSSNFYWEITWTVTYTLTPLNKVSIKIKTNPSEPDVLSPKPKSKVTVTAEMEGKPVKGEEIEIKVCTELGKEDTDGHIHDKRGDPCDKGKRPAAKLIYDNKEVQSPFKGTTNQDGEIIFDYYSPKFGKHYIAGEDKIIATLKNDTSVKDEISIKTKLTYELELMANSDKCIGGKNYFFEAQDNHECIFYGTDQTNAALEEIANEFWDKQNECKNKPNGECIIKDDSLPKSKDKKITITGNSVKMKITAMSLPWGGLHDIGLPDRTEWKTPHSSHKNGKVADIGWGNLDNNRTWLLRYVITNNTNYARFPPDEGGNMTLTQKAKNPHFHIYFLD